MNRNTLYATIFADELARAGLKFVCLAPGSRNTPLVLAFAKHPAIKVFSHLDERSAAFFALGLALASGKPAAMVCTSGTAAANFFPAVIEAQQSHIPLLVLTADRPHELRHSGANQTIDQIKLFGDYPLWFVDAALPEAQPPAVAIRNLRTLAGRAFATANGIRKGVVHVNLPFRAPLEPTLVPDDLQQAPQDAQAREDSTLEIQHVPFTTFASGQVSMSSPVLKEIAYLIRLHHRGLIVCGPGYDAHSSANIQSLAEISGYPVLADPTSGIRYRDLLDDLNACISSSYDTFLAAGLRPKHEPEVIIRLGGVPTSKALNTYLDSLKPLYNIQFSTEGTWADDTHRLTHFIQTDAIELPTHLIWALTHVDEESQEMPQLSLIPQKRDDALLKEFMTLEKQTWAAIDHEVTSGAYFDGAVLHDVVELIPEFSTLFVGNSLPVRLLDQFGKSHDKLIFTYANRGASGIDGNISTALGAGAARPDKPLVAVIGDITFYHDMNGLLAVKRCNVPITLVLLNNNGGGIFQRLPIKDYEPEFTQYFLTPHGLDFSQAAKLYGLDYAKVTDRENFRRAFTESVAQRKSIIIEVPTETKHDMTRRQAVLEAVKAALQPTELHQQAKSS